LMFKARKWLVFPILPLLDATARKEPVMDETYLHRKN